jgi:hypothetical protein
MKSAPPAAIQFTVPGEVISTQEHSRRRRRLRGVLSSLSEFMSVTSSIMSVYGRQCVQSQVDMY